MQRINQLEYAQRDVRPGKYHSGALCSMPQSLADAHCWSAVQ